MWEVQKCLIPPRIFKKCIYINVINREYYRKKTFVQLNIYVHYVHTIRKNTVLNIFYPFNLSFDGGVDSIHLFKVLFSKPKLEFWWSKDMV